MEGGRERARILDMRIRRDVEMPFHFGKSGVPMIYGGEAKLINLLPLRKIKSLEPCLDQSHKPPTHLYLEPGEYEWTCPSCGAKQIFTVPLITFSTFTYNGDAPKQSLFEQG